MGTIPTNVTGDTSEELALVQAAKGGDITAFEQLIKNTMERFSYCAAHHSEPRGR